MPAKDPPVYYIYSPCDFGSDNRMEYSIIPHSPTSYRLGMKAVTAWLGMLGTVAPGAAGSVAYHLWFKPRRFRLPARERPWFRAARREYLITPDNGEVAVYHWGNSGPRILLLHGWNGRATQLGAFVEPLLAAGYQVRAFDCPGHGFSPGRQTNLIDMAHALRAVSARFGPFEAIIGHSFGVAVAVYAMRHLGVTTRRMVCLCPPGRMSYLFHQFCQTMRLPARACEAFDMRVRADFGEDIWEQLSPDVNAELLENVPALLIHDDNDRDVSLNQARILHEAWPGARLLRTTGLGHRKILRDPEVIAHAVRFIDRGNIPDSAE